jgi:hypothetical protein
MMTSTLTTRIVEAMNGDRPHPEGTPVAADYEIRIRGRVGDSVLLAFEGLTATTEPVETILYGPIPDQEALHELLTRLQALGLEVVEIRQLPGWPAGRRSDLHLPREAARRPRQPPPAYGSRLTSTSSRPSSRAQPRMPSSAAWSGSRPRSTVRTGSTANSNPCCSATALASPLWPLTRTA